MIFSTAADDFWRAIHQVPQRLLDVNRTTAAIMPKPMFSIKPANDELTWDSEAMEKGEPL